MTGYAILAFGCTSLGLLAGCCIQAFREKEDKELHLTKDDSAPLQEQPPTREQQDTNQEAEFVVAKFEAELDEDVSTPPGISKRG